MNHQIRKRVVHTMYYLTLEAATNLPEAAIYVRVPNTSILSEQII
jgi:hypothetical protein